MTATEKHPDIMIIFLGLCCRLERFEVHAELSVDTVRIRWLLNERIPLQDASDCGWLSQMFTLTLLARCWADLETISPPRLVTGDEIAAASVMLAACD